VKRLPRIAGAVVACALTVPGAASAAWTPTRTVSGDEPAQRDFGQAVAPDGTGTVVWSTPASGMSEYRVFGRAVDQDGSLGEAFALSTPDPSAVLSAASSPSVAYAGEVATAVWLESTYDSEVCLNDPYAPPPDPEDECVVTQYVKSRQIAADGSLGSIQVLDQRQTAYSAEGPFGGSGAAFVSYGQPALAAGPGGTVTVLWSEAAFAEGCSSYGYAYDDEGCAADHFVKWVRLSAGGTPLGAPATLFTGHSQGHGAAQSLVRLQIGAAADGTATAVLSARAGDEESGCWGGEMTIQTRRIETDGSASPLEEIDTGCGWTEPRLAVNGGGAAVVVWAWAEPYAVNEIRYSRISVGGVPDSPQPLVAPDPEMTIAPPAVAFGPSSATAIWGADGSLQSRSIPITGALGDVRTLASAPSPDLHLDGLDFALASDGSGTAVWEAGQPGGPSLETGVKAIELAPDGTPGTVRTLLPPNRWDHGPRVAVGPGDDFSTAWRLSVPREDAIQVARPASSAPMANDDFDSAETIAGALPRFAAGSNDGATVELGEPPHAGDPGGASLWYSWTPASSGPVAISTCSSEGIDTLLGVYVGDAVDQLSEVRSNDDDAASDCAGGDSGVRFGAVAGTTYRIAVDGRDGSEGSFALEVARLPQSLANDDFSEALPLGAGLPSSRSGSTLGATKEPGEPPHAGDPGGASLWYSWTPASSGPVAIFTCFSGSFDPLLAAYTGTSIDDLTEVASDDDGAVAPECEADDGEIRFDAVAGTTYRIAVDGQAGGAGFFTLQLLSLPANDDFAKPQVLEGFLSAFASGDSRFATREAEEPIHAGAAGGGSLWYSWTPSGSGKVAISTCSFGPVDPLLAVYTGSSFPSLSALGSDDDGAAGCAGKDAEVRLDVVAGTTYRIAIDAKGEGRGFFSLLIQPLPANDDFAAAIPIADALPQQIFGSNGFATKQDGEPEHGGEPGGASVWYSWTPTFSRPVTISACSFGFMDTLLGVYTGPSLDQLTAVETSDEGAVACPAEDSAVVFPAVAGTTYWIAVDGADGGEGDFTLELSSAPRNDEFSEAQPIAADLPRSVFGSNRGATKQDGEPEHGGEPGGASVWYSWTPTSSGPVAIYTCSFGGLDPLLAVYTGSSFEGLADVASSDDGPSDECSADDSEVRFEATAGTAYRIAVDGKAGSSGGFDLRLSEPPTNDDLAGAIELSDELPDFRSGWNRFATKQDGEPEHGGDPGGASVWYSWTPTSGGAVEVSVCGLGAFDPLLAVYTGEGFEELTEVAGASVGPNPECSGGGRTVSFTSTTGMSYLVAVDGSDGGEGAFDLAIRGRPANDDFANAETVDVSLPVNLSGTNRFASKQDGEPEHGGEPGGASVWYSATAPVSAAVKISVCAHGVLDPLLAVYTGTVLGDLTEVVGDHEAEDDPECTGGRRELRFTVEAGTKYWLAVDGRDGGEGAFDFSLRFGGPDNDDFADAIEIDQPRALVSGTTLGATVEAGEDPGGFPSAQQTVWYRWTAPGSGPVHLHTCTDSGAPMDVDVFVGSSLTSLSRPPAVPTGTFPACIFGAPGGGGPGSVGSTPAAAFQAVAGAAYWISVDTYFQISPSFERRPPGPFVLAVNTPANDLRAGAERLPAGGGGVSRSSAGATKEAAGLEFDHAGDPGGASVWFRWFAVADGPVTIDTCDSGFDTLLDASSIEGTVSSDDSEACGPGSTRSSVAFEAVEGRDYTIAVDGKAGASGAIELAVDFDVPDTTPPQTSAFVPSSWNSLQLQFAAEIDEPESVLECALDEDAFEPCDDVNGDFGFVNGTVSVPTEGAHILEIREVDLAGNADPTPVRAEFAIDLVAPETTISEGPKGLTRFLGPFGFSADEPAFFECALDGDSFAFCDSPHFPPGSPPDGDHTFRVRAIDAAGNADASPATRSFTLDRTAPVTTIDQGPVGTVETASVSFDFSADEAATFRCRIDGGPETACASPRAFSGLSDGDHSFAVRATDTAGNVGAPAARSFRVEARPPETTLKSGPPPHTIETSAVFAFSSDEQGSTFECSLDETPFGTCDEPGEVAGLGDGEHTFRVRAIDAAGKPDPTPAEHSWTVDTIAPETAVDSGPSGLTRHRGPFVFSSNETQVEFECAVDDILQFDPCGTSHFISVADGEHTLWVRAVDPAGNADATPAERTLTLDTTPPVVEIVEGPAVVTKRDVEVEFEVDDGEASSECSIDGNSFSPCSSPVEFEDLSEGEHEIRVRATDPAGNVSPPATIQFTVDETPPETTISSAPPDHTADTSVTVGFGGSSDAAEFECALDEEPMAECSSPVSYDGLADGPHLVRVVAIDSVGNVDPTPAEANFVVDTAPPDTIIASGPTGPVHDRIVPFEYESSEDPGGFQCSLDGASFAVCGTVEHDRRVGDHLFRVRALDRAGNVDPSPAEHPFTVVNQDPVPSLSLDSTTGPAPLEVTATVGGDDPDGDGMQFDLQWGEGPDSNGTLPRSALAHTYTQPGVYLLRLELDDGYAKTSVTRVVTVSPPEPLRADAGDDQTAVVGEPVLLDGANTRPLRGISGYQWSLGDGAQKSGAVVEHTYSKPGDYEVELTVSRPGETAVDTATVHVAPPPPQGPVGVLVRGDGAPLAGADVLVILADGRRIQALSGAGGIARLHGLPDGSHKVYAQKSGYIPAVGNVTVSDGQGDGEVAMRTGQVATATVESHRMTLEEIEAAGIDPDDPANQHIFEFEVHIDLDLPGGDGSPITHSIGGYIGPNGYIGPHCEQITPRLCRSKVNGARVYTRMEWLDELNAPLLSSLVIPFRATFLKEFYEVSLIVHNLADPGFTLRNGHAAIEVPSGMSLAPTSKPQSSAVDVPDIAGRSSATVDWILRGDKEGEYDIAAHYAASLEPFGRTIRLEGRTAEPIKVWGASALRLVVDVDEEAFEGYPYTVMVKLENVSDVPVYNPAVELLRAGRVGYIEQPRQRHTFAIRELAPGATHTAGPFILVPEPSGLVDLRESFIRKTAGDVDLNGTIVTHERSPSFEDTPGVETRGYGTKLVIDWEPVGGASDYQVFQTLDRQTDFGSDPLSVRQLDSSKVVVDGVDPDSPAYYAISSLLDVPTMVHPLTVASGNSNRMWPRVAIVRGDRCAQRDPGVELRFEAIDFELESYEVKVNDGAAGAGRPLDGFSANVIESVPFPSHGEDVTVEVILHDSEGNQRTARADLSCNYLALGDSFASGEGAPDFIDTNGCHKSEHAYSRLVKQNAPLAVAGDRLEFHACSGAKLFEMYNGNQDHPGEPRQLSHVGSDAHLITLSIGGNDMLFDDIVKSCLVLFSLIDLNCKDDHLSEFEDGFAKVRKELPELLRTIRGDAPHARILVVEYPQIFPSFPFDPVDFFELPNPFGGPLAACHQLFVDNVRPWDVVWLSDMQRMSNEMIREAVEGSGSGAEYVSMGDRFDGHDVCQEFDPWFNGANIVNVAYSFHPNAEGQAAMAEAVLSHLGEPAPRKSLTVAFKETARRTFNVTAGPVGRAIFSQWWPGSDVELTLESPAGRVIERGTEAADVEHTLGPTSETYVVDDPEPGEWVMEFEGLDVAPGGEEVTYEATAVEEENLPPSALFTQSANGARLGQPIEFDAGASSDLDGEVVDYEWNFDDGSQGSGEVVEHSFSAPGLYTVRLLVHDDRGGAAAYAQKEIWVRNTPQAKADSYSAGWGSRLDVSATAGLLANDSVDRLGGVPIVELVSPPTHGDLVLGPDGAFTYQPDTGFAGSDSFTYRVKDAGGFASAPATASIGVSGPVTKPNPGGSGSSSPPGAAAPAPPATAGSPETTIVKLRARGNQATVWFSGSGRGPLSFACALDGKPFAVCSSPKAYKKIKPGQHSIRVRAQDGGGVFDPTPATKKLKIKAKEPSSPRKRQRGR